MSGCGIFLGTHWIDDDLSMSIICGGSIIDNNRQYCKTCKSRLPGCHKFIDKKNSYCGIPRGMSGDKIPTTFCTECRDVILYP